MIWGCEMMFYKIIVKLFDVIGTKGFVFCIEHSHIMILFLIVILGICLCAMNHFVLLGVTYFSSEYRPSHLFDVTLKHIMNWSLLLCTIKVTYMLDSYICSLSKELLVGATVSILVSSQLLYTYIHNKGLYSTASIVFCIMNINVSVSDRGCSNMLIFPG